jgi:ABC-type nitrate/sulfonate/bicarbonate transport system substrate-binding protein
VKVKVLNGGATVDSTAIVAAGKADIGLADPDNIARANANGADLVIIGATFQKNPLAVLSKASNPIKTPKDMYGKTIAIPAIDQPQQDALVKINKLDASKITVIPAQFDVSPLTSGQADGLYVYYTEQPIALQEAGIKPYTMLLADYGQLLYGDTYFTTKSYLKSHEDTLVKFMSAQQKGWSSYVKNQSKSVDLAVNDYGKGGGLTVSQQTQMAALQVDIIQTPYTKAHGLLSMSATDIKDNLNTMKQMGIKGAGSSLFSTAVIDKVNASK